MPKMAVHAFLKLGSLPYTLLAEKLPSACSHAEVKAPGLMKLSAYAGLSVNILKSLI